MRSLGTADFREASSRAAFEPASIEAEFVQRRKELDLSRASLVPRRVHQLSGAELDAIGRRATRQFLQAVVKTLDLQLARQAGEPVGRRRPC